MDVRFREEDQVAAVRRRWKLDESIWAPRRTLSSSNDYYEAEADVLAANYRAKAQNKEIFLAETQRDIAQTMYANLKDFQITMPQNVIVGAGDGRAGPGKLPSNLDVITGFSALGVMEKALRASGQQ